jgi:SAM-dependent methyltransferase
VRLPALREKAPGDACRGSAEQGDGGVDDSLHDPALVWRRDTGVAMSQEDYLLADQPSELERLQLQSRVWEPAGRQLLERIGGGSGQRALDVGCGALGWLRILGEWVGPSGQVVGTDIDESLLNAARSFLEAEGISNVELVIDDLFETKLQPQAFDLVHARYVIAPLGRGGEQVATYRRLVRPGGSLVLEEWDLGSWHFNPAAPAAERLIRLLSEIFATLGGEAGRGLPELFRGIGIEEPEIDAHVRPRPSWPSRADGAPPSP